MDGTDYYEEIYTRIEKYPEVTDTEIVSEPVHSGKEKPALRISFDMTEKSISNIMN